MAELGRLVDELRRRKVLRSVALYVAGAAAVLQTADLVFPRIGIPDSIITGAVVLAVFGLPVVIALAWVFQIAPEADAPLTKMRHATLRLPVFARIMAVAAVVILALTGAALTLSHRGGTLVSNRVFVVPFENRSNQEDIAHVGRMVADWVARGAAELDGLEVIDPGTAVTALRAVEKDSAWVRGEESADALADETGARLIVTGSYVVERDTVILQALITDARSGRIVRTLPLIRGAADDLTTSLEEMRERVMGALATLVDSRVSQTSTLAMRPPLYSAYQEYIAGMDAPRPVNIRHLERAAQLDTSFLPPRISLARIYVQMFRGDKADSIARTVLPHERRLSSLDRHELRYIVAVAASNWSEALRHATAAAELAPGSNWHVVSAARALDLNRPRQALSTLDKLSPEQRRIRDDRTYWNTRASILHRLGRHEDELADARRAHGISAAGGSAVTAQLKALAALGRWSEVDALLQQVDLWGDGMPTVGFVFANVGLEARAHHGAGAARRYFERGLAWEKSQTPSRRESDVMRGLRAGLLASLDSLDEAVPLIEELVRELDSPFWHYARGHMAARQGDKVTALRVLDYLETDPKDPQAGGMIIARGGGDNSYMQAGIAAAMGDRERAVGYLRRAFSQGYRFHGNIHIDEDFEPLRGYAPFEQLMKPIEN